MSEFLSVVISGAVLFWIFYYVCNWKSSTVKSKTAEANKLRNRQVLSSANMPMLDITCPICTESFQNGDDIHSTNCGHSFHFGCMRGWLIREHNCPQCRRTDITTHKIDLSFEESQIKVENLEEMQIKLKSSEEKVTELLEQKKEVKSNFLQLQAQLTTAETSEKELAEILSQMHNSEEDFLSLQAQYTESSENIKQLEDRINQLFIQNECMIRELDLKTKENESLKQHKSLPDSVLNEKIEATQFKLRLVTNELEREIGASTQLTIEKIKLQNYIKNFNSMEGKENDKPKENNKKKNPVNKNKRNKKALHGKKHQNDNENTDSVFIKELPLSLITIPLEDVVLNLAAKMNVSISEGDVVKVNIVDNNNEMSAKAQLFAQFKNSVIKDKFLSNKNILQNDPVTKTICIEEFVSNDAKKK